MEETEVERCGESTQSHQDIRCSRKIRGGGAEKLSLSLLLSLPAAKVRLTSSGHSKHPWLLGPCFHVLPSGQHPKGPTAHSLFSSQPSPSAPEAAVSPSEQQPNLRWGRSKSGIKSESPFTFDAHHDYWPPICTHV